jgi:MFS family permease
MSQYDGQHRATDQVTTTTSAEPEQSTGELVSRLSQDVSRLVRDELRLAQAEVSGKAKKAGIGAGMFGAAGVLAGYGVGVLIATVILALALALPAWLAALIVGVVILVVAGIVALVGKKRVTEAAPPVPERAVDNVKRDVDAVRHARDH